VKLRAALFREVPGRVGAALARASITPVPDGRRQVRGARDDLDVQVFESGRFAKTRDMGF
jgi:hypothetical protein